MAITDRESAEAWLADKPHDVQVAFAARCALRAMPGLGTASIETLRRICLPVLRATLHAGVGAVRMSLQVTNAANSADISANKAASAALKSSARSAEITAKSASFAAAAVDCQPDAFGFASGAAGASVASAAATSVSSSAASSAAYSACDADAKTLVPEDGPASSTTDVFRTALWPTEVRNYIPPGEPDGLAENYKKLVAFFESDPQVWGFWQRWLEGMRTGQPMDWDLQREIALIGKDDDFKIWGDGPEAVAEKIREIEARFAVRTSVGALQGALLKTGASRHGIGGNRPPEPIESMGFDSADFAKLWQASAVLVTEAEKPVPDKAVILKCISFLRDLLLKCASYTGSTLHAGVQAGAKAVGTAGGAALMAWLSGNGHLVTQVVEAAETLLKATP